MAWKSLDGLTQTFFIIGFLSSIFYVSVILGLVGESIERRLQRKRSPKVIDLSKRSRL